MNPPTTTPVVPEVKFDVFNRSRAEKVAKVLYGPTARVWVGRGPGVEIGTETAGTRVVKTAGTDLSSALRGPVQEYLADNKTAWARAKQMFALRVDVTEFITGRDV